MRTDTDMYFNMQFHSLWLNMSSITAALNSRYMSYLNETVNIMLYSRLSPDTDH